MRWGEKRHQQAHTQADSRNHMCGTRYIALQLTLSGRSSGAEYTCYQSGHIPNHSTIADQLLPRKVPRSTNLSYSTLHLTVSLAKAPFSYPILFPRGVSLHPFPPPSFHPHPLPKRQSTCTAAFVVDGAVLRAHSETKCENAATGPPLLSSDWLLIEALGRVLVLRTAPHPNDRRAAVRRFKVSWSVP